jgi:hypothetical protein
MALYQDTTTVISSRPELRSIPDARTGPYRDTSLPSRLSATVAGALAIVVGAWGGIAPYVGHALHYSIDGSATWTWNLQHGLLSLLPGAMAVVGGTIVIVAAWVRRDRRSVRRTVGLGVATGLLGLSAVWFLIGSWVWPVYFSSHLLVGTSPLRTFANVSGTYLAEGFILATIAGVVGTWAVRSLPDRSEHVIL